MSHVASSAHHRSVNPGHRGERSAVGGTVPAGCRSMRWQAGQGTGSRPSLGGSTACGFPALRYRRNGHTRAHPDKTRTPHSGGVRESENPSRRRSGNAGTRQSFPYPVAPIVAAHHERWDGTGYPQGLKGEEIPIGARILAVVDGLDSLCAARRYRSAMTLQEAMSPPGSRERARLRSVRGLAAAQELQALGAAGGRATHPRLHPFHLLRPTRRAGAEST